MDNNIEVIESYYNKYINDLSGSIPEGILDIDIEVLHRMELLEYYKNDQRDTSLTRYFHVIETEEKITLINDDFIVWIVPDRVDNIAITYTLIALNKDNVPKLEMAFSAAGVYNTSRLVLRVLEKYLMDIQENEDTMNKIKEKTKN